MEYQINVHLRFYEELNDFLSNDRQKIRFTYQVAPKTSVKDVVESLGVPHPEIDLILVNGKSVDFLYQVQNDDNISVYPVFEKLDISEIIRLRPAPLRNMRFILDVHLGKLAKHLRLLGFDTDYQNDRTDAEIVMQSLKEHRLILTRDIGLLKHKKITHGHWMRNTDPEKQLDEVLTQFDLYRLCQPFTRCLECNSLLTPVLKENIVAELLPMTSQYYENFMRCSGCGRIYWEGTHYQKLKKFVEKYVK